MIINYNGTYRGFLLIYNKDGSLICHKDNATCCQAIKDYKSAITDKIVFGFPDDWLPNEFRNTEFLKWWCKIVSVWFTEVKYTGDGKASDLLTTCDKANSQNGYIGGQSQGLPINKGDLITNDKWRMFEIKCDHSKVNFSIFNYSAFVLVRYLFCTYYQMIVKNYLRYKYYLTDVDSMKHVENIEDFKLLQLAHYVDPYKYYGNRAYKTNQCGYNSTYGMLPYFLSQESITSNNGLQHRPWKLVSLEDCKNRLIKEPSLSLVFSQNNINSTTVNEVQELLKRQKIYKAYEAIN